MKTADFLAPKAFLDHLERRRTPKRVFIVLAYSLVCIGGVAGLELETQHQIKNQILATAPDEAAQIAREELERLLVTIRESASRLDPLSEHLSMPVAGEILTKINNDIGHSFEFEQIRWTHRPTQDRSGRITAKLEMVVTGRSRDTSLIDQLEQTLKNITGFEEAYTQHQGIVDGGRHQFERLEVTLTGGMTLSSALKEKFR